MRSDLRVKDNVLIRLLKEDKVVTEVSKHNVFLNTGRAWLATLVGSAAYPVGLPDTDLGTSATYSLQSSWSSPGSSYTYRLRWVAVGTGGTFGGGAYTELPSITGLEAPVLINGTTHYYKELAAQTSSNLSNPGSIWVRATIGAVEVSNIGVGYYGTTVPVTEFGLFTSAANVTLGAAPTAGAPGIVAYGICNPIYKTPAMDLEITWEITFK